MLHENISTHDRLKGLCCNRLYLHDVQFWQQVAVRQGELVAIQEAADGELLVLRAVRVDLVRQGAVHVVVQLLQGSGQALF